MTGNSETSCFSAVQRGDRLRPFPTKIVARQVDLVAYLQGLESPARPMLVKMDIEGGEFALLPHVHDFCRRHGAIVLASLHPQNIVMSTPDDTGATRITRVAAALDRYTDFHWYGFRDGAIVVASKLKVLEAVMNNLGREHSLLMSPGPLADVG